MYYQKYNCIICMFFLSFLGRFVDYFHKMFHTSIPNYFCIIIVLKQPIRFVASLPSYDANLS